MRHKITGLLLSCLLASAAFGQAPVTRTYAFTHVAAGQELNEMFNLMRTIASLTQAAPVDGQKSLLVAGPAAQIGITDFLFQELDQPAQTPSTLTHLYTVAPDDVVRIFYLPAALSTQDFQEASNGVRVITQIRLAIALNTPHALVMRATPAQIAQAEFLLNDLAQTAHTAIAHSYPIGADDVTQIFYLPHAAAVQDFQEIANMIRTIVEIRSIAAINAPRALVARSTPAQLAMAAWLVNELEQAQTAPAAPSYTAGADDFVRVFYFPGAISMNDFQANANAIRTTAQIRRAVAIGTRRAFTVRGTTSQLDLAQRLVTDLSKPR